MIADINHNSGRNLDLIEDRIKQLKAAVSEADRHIEFARRELDSQKAKLSYHQKIEAAVHSKNSQPVLNNSTQVAERYLRNQNISAGLQSVNRYEITEEGSRHVQQESQPGDLFSQAEFDEKRQIVSDTGTTFTVESDGSSYASVPVIGGNVSYADDPIQPQKSFRERVHDLNAAGWSVDEIARELKLSTIEVQMSLEMGGGF